MLEAADVVNLIEACTSWYNGVSATAGLRELMLLNANVAKTNTLDIQPSRFSKANA